MARYGNCHTKDFGSGPPLLFNRRKKYFFFNLDILMRRVTIEMNSDDKKNLS
jgi:hypothetical protein